MQIDYGFDIEIFIPQDTAIVTILDIHSSRAHDIQQDLFTCSSDLSGGRVLTDTFGNRSRAFRLPAGVHSFHHNDPRVTAELPRELSMPHINGEDTFHSTLK